MVRAGTERSKTHPRLVRAKRPHQMFSTRNGSATWTEARDVALPDALYALTDAVSGAAAYVVLGSHRAVAMWRTTDGGVTWTRVPLLC